MPKFKTGDRVRFNRDVKCDVPRGQVWPKKGGVYTVKSVRGGDGRIHELITVADVDGQWDVESFDLITDKEDMKNLKITRSDIKSIELGAMLTVTPCMQRHFTIGQNRAGSFVATREEIVAFAEALIEMAGQHA